jgi:hypothetical protein
MNSIKLLTNVGNRIQLSWQRKSTFVNNVNLIMLLVVWVELKILHI